MNPIDQFKQVAEEQIMDAYGGFGNHYVQALTTAAIEFVETELDNIVHGTHRSPFESLEEVINDRIAHYKKLKEQV